MLELKNISKKYGDTMVFRDFSISVGSGERIALFGRSGCGKTTLTRLILGLEKPDSGCIVTDEKFSVVFQENRLFSDFTVYENLNAVTLIDKNIDPMLKTVGLYESKNSKPTELSGGMARRGAIARALVFPHTALILDEPFTGIDDNTKNAIIGYLKENEKGIIILISHDIRECNALCDRIIQL